MLDLMTIREVAEVLKVSTSRIYSQRSEGHPFFAGKGVAVGRHVRYRREDVIAYIEECANAN
jgi:excisionase family DNA binding protein